MPLSRRQLTRVVLGGSLAALLAACQAPAATPTATPANALVKPRANGSALTVVQASSELAIGRNRFAIGLIDERNQPLTSGSVTIEFFRVISETSAQKRAESAAVFRSVGGPSKGIWVTQADFPETGSWGARVTLGPGNGTPLTAQLLFQVQSAFSAPGYDQPALRSASLTERDVNGETAHICSNSPPCEFHVMSIAEALTTGQKPLVLLFATPALCTSALCAPELQAIQQLHATHGDAANFIHVEIYQHPFDGVHTVKTVDEWKLPSEPWTFVIDRGGIVRDRFEGAAPVEELEPSLRAVLG